MKILVCGGRSYNDYKNVCSVLDGIIKETDSKKVLIIEGGARGADRLARQYAIEKGYNYKTYKAKWDLYGKSAGIRRNIEMLQDGKPDVVVGFPGGKGTKDMVQRSIKSGVKVVLA